MSVHRRLYHVLSLIIILTMLFSGFAMPPASAQGSDGIERQVNAQTGKISFIGPEQGPVLSASQAPGLSYRPQNPAMALAKRFGHEFGLTNPERDLSEIKTNLSEGNRIAVHYQQNYQGVPVMGGALIVNTNRNGDLYSINGEVSTELSLDIQAKIDVKQARQTALQVVAESYEKTPEDFLASEPALWIYDESLLRPSTRPAELVWRMEVTPKDPGMLVRELVLVNAHRGNISLHFNQVDMAWSLHGSSAAVIDPTVTPTPLPTETTASTETANPSETPILSETPIPSETSIPAEMTEEPVNVVPTEEVSTPTAPINELTTLAGATWYVSTTGDNSNSCSAPASPCLTIDGAIAKAGAGDIIQVAGGTYTGSGPEVVLINKSITLLGGWDNAFSTQNATSVIDGQGARRGEGHRSREVP